MAQQAAPMRIGHRDAPEMAPVHVPDSVEARQPFVHERVVRRQQLLERPILTELVFKEQFGLAREVLAQIVVEAGVQPRIRIDDLHVAKVEPLAAEVFHQRARAGIRQHPPNLLLQGFRIVERAALRQIEQRLVRYAAPEEE